MIKTTWRVTKQLAQAILGKAYLWQEKFHEAAVVLNEVRASGKYKLYDGNYEDILTYKAEYNCESMLEVTVFLMQVIPWMSSVSLR